MNPNPKEIIEETISELEGTEFDHLTHDLERASEQLPNAPSVEITDVSASKRARGSIQLHVAVDGSPEEALYELIREASKEFVSVLRRAEPSRDFPVDEARENSLDHIESLFCDVSDAASRDIILFSKKEMPKNPFAVERILKRMPNDSNQT
jgi:hypothetical protein